MWASIAIERDPGALTYHLDAIVATLPGGESGPDERWVSGASQGLEYEAPMRALRYWVEHRKPGHGLILLDRYSEPSRLVLWSRRFRSADMAARVYAWLFERHLSWSRWAGLIMERGDDAFDAYLAQQIDGYADAIRPRSGSRRG